MRIDHDLQWMKPYIKNALKVFPKLKKKIKEIHCVKTSKDLDIDPPCVAYYEEGKIYLSLYRDKVRWGNKFNRVELFEFLAHEFTHFWFDDHTPAGDFVRTEAEILKAMIDGLDVRKEETEKKK